LLTREMVAAAVPQPRRPHKSPGRPLNLADESSCRRPDAQAALCELRHVAPLELTLLALVLGGLMLLPPTLIVESPSPGADLPLALWSLALLGVIGTGLTMFLFNRLIRDHGPLFAGMVTNLIPVGAVIWAWVDHEQVTPKQISALAGLLAMVTLVQYGAAVPTNGTVARELAGPPD